MAYSGETWMSIVCHLKMHTSNYCSWLSVCVNYSANFYCNIALINRYKLYLIKTYITTPKKQKSKQNVNKNNVEYILSLHLVNVTWRHPGWHYNVTPGDRGAVNIIYDIVAWPTTSCFADWSRVTSATWRWALSYVHRFKVTRGDIIMSPRETSRNVH